MTKQGKRDGYRRTRQQRCARLVEGLGERCLRQLTRDEWSLATLVTLKLIEASPNVVPLERYRAGAGYRWRP